MMVKQQQQQQQPPSTAPRTFDVIKPKMSVEAERYLEGITVKMLQAAKAGDFNDSLHYLFSIKNFLKRLKDKEDNFIDAIINDEEEEEEGGEEEQKPAEEESEYEEIGLQQDEREEMMKKRKKGRT
jgi:hypothetical protein